MFVAATGGAFGTCIFSGDVHYLTFDGAHFDYQGVCKYQVANYCGSDPMLTEFEIYARNEYRYGMQQVSWLQYFEIVYNGSTIKLGPGLTAKVCSLIVIIMNSILIFC
jgi:von Willebrand factor type D domain